MHWYINVTDSPSHLHLTQHLSGQRWPYERSNLNNARLDKGMKEKQWTCSPPTCSTGSGESANYWIVNTITFNLREEKKIVTRVGCSMAWRSANLQSTRVYFPDTARCRRATICCDKLWTSHSNTGLPTRRDNPLTCRRDNIGDSPWLT